MNHHRNKIKTRELEEIVSRDHLLNVFRVTKISCSLVLEGKTSVELTELTKLTWETVPQLL